MSVRIVVLKLVPTNYFVVNVDIRETNIIQGNFKMNESRKKLLLQLIDIYLQEGQFKKLFDTYLELNMPGEAINSFKNISSINNRKELLSKVGLLYIKYFSLEQSEERETTLDFFFSNFDDANFETKMNFIYGILLCALFESDHKSFIKSVKKSISFLEQLLSSVVDNNEKQQIISQLIRLNLVLFSLDNLIVYKSIQKYLEYELLESQIFPKNMFFDKIFLLYSLDKRNDIFNKINFNDISKQALSWFNDVQKQLDSNEDIEKLLLQTKKDVIATLDNVTKPKKSLSSWQNIDEYINNLNIFRPEILGFEIVLEEINMVEKELAVFKKKLEDADNKFKEKKYYESMELLDSITAEPIFELLEKEHKEKIYLSIAKCALEITDWKKFDLIWQEMLNNNFIENEADLLSELDNENN
jgi:hypothetical protein